MLALRTWYDFLGVRSLRILDFGFWIIFPCPMPYAQCPIPNLNEETANLII